MQKLLFADYMDGSAKPSEYKDIVIKCIIDTFVEMAGGRKFVTAGKYKVAMDLEFGEEIVAKVALKLGLPIEEVRKIVYLLEIDQYSRVFCAAVDHFQKNPTRKYYVVSQNLKNRIATIPFDVTWDCIPKNYAAYFECEGFVDDDGEPIRCVYVSTYESAEGRRFLTIGFPTIAARRDQYALRTLQLPMLDHSSIEKTYDEYNRNPIVQKENEELNKDAGGRVKILNQEKIVDSQALRTIFNLILYSINPLEKVFEEMNKLSLSPTIRNIQKKKMTLKKFTRLGYKDIDFLTIQAVKIVDPYWKSQHWGPKNSLRRPQLIAGYERPGKTFSEAKE